MQPAAATTPTLSRCRNDLTTVRRPSSKARIVIAFITWSTLVTHCCSYLHRFEAGGEVAQEWGLVGEFHASDLLALFPDVEDDFDYVVDVALRVDAAGNCKAHEVHFCGRAEH